jgi:hypothetical protein
LKEIQTYTKYESFLKELETKAHLHVPFKFFGPKKKNNNKGTFDFHSLSAVRVVYTQTENPDDDKDQGEWNAPYGKIIKYGMRADSNAAYTKVISPNGAGINCFQGDIFKLEKNVDFIVPTSLVMILSHSCDVENGEDVSVLPVYRNTDLISDLGNASILRGAKVKDSSVIPQWVSNNNKLFVGMPPVYIEGQTFNPLVYLKDQRLISKKLLKTSPDHRLSYRFLMYLQMRYMHLYFRDVQDSDESRDI